MKCFLTVALIFVSFGACAAPPAADLGNKPGRKAPAKDEILLHTALDSRGIGSHETNAGNLVADAVRESGRASAAFVVADEFAELVLPAGPISPAQLLKLLHYADDEGDTVVVLTLTGKQIRLAAERSVSRVPNAFDGFLQMSGLQVRFDPKQLDTKRVASVKIGGADVNPDQTYKVAVTRALADGGQGFFRIWGRDPAVEQTHVTVAQSLSAYAAARKTLDARVEGRIAVP